MGAASSFAIKANIDLLRSLAYTGISGTYAAVGTPFAHNVRIICLTNNTDGDMFFSINGTNNHLFVAATSFKLFDVSSNRTAVTNIYAFPIGLQLYVKQSTMPSKGAVYIEALY